MKKISDRSFEIFAVLTVCGAWAFYRNEIILKLDEIFLSFLGKSLSGRNLPIRFAVYAGLFLLSLVLPFLFDRLLCRNPKYQKIADGLISAMMTIPIIRLMIICANQRLRRDDYWEIADARTFGFPGSMFVEIRRYNGRYLSWGLRSLYAILPPVPFINVVLCLNILIFTAGASMLALQLLKCQSAVGDRSGIRVQAILTGSAVLFAAILMASNIWEFWFWGSGVMVYGLGLSLCVLTTALAARIAADPSKRGKSLILPGILCFLSCGCSELCTASLAVFLLIILIWKRILSKRWDKRLIFLFTEVCFCCIGIFMLTGSMNYAGGYAHIDEQQKNALAILIERIPSIFGWAFDALWGYTFINYKLMMLFLGIFFIFGTQLHFSSHTRKQLVIIAVLLIITGQSVLFINSALDYMPPRVVTVGICWVMAAGALLCFAAGSLLSSENRAIPDRAKTALCALLLGLCIRQFYSSNIDELRTIRGSWFVRDRVLLQSAGSGEDVETCSLPCRGSFREDILPEPDSPYNTGIASYYGFSSIRAEHRCPPYGPSFIDFSDSEN